MKLLTRPAGWLVVVLLFPAVAQAREDWIHARTEHFEMFSCAGERESTALLNDLERFRQVFLSVFNLPKVREPRCTVVMFDSDRRFKPYKPLYNGKPKNVGGYFIGHPDEAVIALSTEWDRELTRQVILHEYVHLLLHSYDLHPPLWLNEGLAELYSTFTITGEQAELGKASPYHVLLLQRTRLTPLGRLFAVSYGSPDYNEGLRQGIFYAQSWALLHYWLCGQDQATYRPQMRAFMDALEKPGAMPEACFREAFGVEYGEMERRLSRYLSSGRYFRTKIDLSKLPALPAVQFAPAAGHDLELALINLRWRCHESGDTELKLLEMADRLPRSPRPPELLAALALRQDEPVLARDRLLRAAELGSGNAYVYVQLAAASLATVTTEPSLDYRMPAAFSAQLRGWLDRAIELSPDYDEAFEHLAAVEAYSADPRVPTVNRIQRRFSEMRNKTRVLLYLAIMRWRVKDDATAREIVELLETADKATPAIKAAARQLLSRLPAPEPVASAVVGESRAGSSEAALQR